LSVLTVNQHNYITQATINRPKAHNAINFAVMDELEELLSDLETNNHSRCFILRGSGDEAFISGGDLREFHTIKTAKEAKPMAKRMRSILERIEILPCWTIACVNGAAYGGGCEIMLGFDFRIASSGATFGFTQGKFYLPPGWGGLTRLVERVGRSTALRWLAETAIIDTDKALEHRLIDRISTHNKLQEETWKWAKDLCHNDRDYIKALKQGALRLTEARWKAIEQELEPFAKFWEDERHQQRVKKFLNRKSGDN
jgi:enoyl-CoA hydratase/carnithine racemase